MNFKDWMKTAEDDKTVTLVHPKGHKMTIYSYALPKIQREQIKRLKFAKGGKVPHYEEGADDVEPGDATKPVEININTDHPQDAAAGTSQPPSPQAQNIPSKPTLQGTAQNVLNANDLAQQSANNQQQVDTAKAKELEPAVAENIQGQNQLTAQHNQSLSDLNTHVGQFADWMNENGVIDPKHYQKSDDYSPTATAIGLFLGGLSTPFGGHNYAFDFLNKQIDRDIAAQQQSNDNKKTVLGAFQHLYGENEKAVLATRAALDHVYARRVEQAAIKNGSQQALANAQMAKSKFTMDAADKLYQAASLSGGNVGGQPAAQGQPGAAPQKTSEHILNPNYNDTFSKAQFNPLLKESVGKIAEQKQKASLADDAIDRINQAFPMLEAAKSGDNPSGYIQRHASALDGIPIVGKGLHGAMDVLTDRPVNRDYNSAYSSVVGAVRGSLQGNVSDDLLDSTIKANAPETGDSPQRVQMKLRTLKQFIKDHTPHDMLDMANMTNKKK